MAQGVNARERFSLSCSRRELTSAATFSSGKIPDPFFPNWPLASAFSKGPDEGKEITPFLGGNSRAVASVYPCGVDLT